MGEVSHRSRAKTTLYSTAMRSGGTSPVGKFFLAQRLDDAVMKTMTVTTRSSRRTVSCLRRVLSRDRFVLLKGWRQTDAQSLGFAQDFLS
jgi:hypothetical protein